MRKIASAGKLLSVGLLLCTGFVTGASAETTLRVGKGNAREFSFVPLDIGIEQGFWKQRDLGIESVSFNGAAKQEQGLAAGAIDVALGSGPEMSFVAKGNADKGVAVFFGPPAGFTLFIGNNPAIKDARDLKGKRLSVTTVGSLPDWLTHQFARKEGWGQDGVTVIPLGAHEAQIAALRTGQTDGMFIDLVGGTVLEHQGLGKIMVHFDTVVPKFITGVIFASGVLVKDHPEQVRAFLAGWFQTIRYMRDHKAESVKIAAAEMQQPSDVIAVTYDVAMKNFSLTGKFDADSLAVLRQSFIDTGVLKDPDMSKLYTEELLPK